MKKASTVVKASGVFPIRETLDQALRGRFFLTADLSVPLQQRMSAGRIIDRGSFALRSGGLLGVEKTVLHGMFRLHEAGQDRRTHDVLRTFFRPPPRPKRTWRKSRPASTHELVDLGCRLPEILLERRVVTFGRDDFAFIDGEDMPHASVLFWSEKEKSLILESQLLYQFKWLSTDAVLMWA